MKIVSLIIALSLMAGHHYGADESIEDGRAANTVILDKTAVENLRIETEMIEERDFESTVFAIGRLEEIPANRSVLSSRISGRVVDLKVYPGDLVKQGQVLALVESRQPGSPPPTIELKARQGGMIVDSHIRLGEPVEPDEDLLDISDRSKLWAVAKIPEPEAVGILPGTKARIKIPALGNNVVEATLSRYGVEADREAGAIEGIFVIDNTDGRLQPGMRAEFSIIKGVRKNVMAVPRSAIQGDPTKRVVFVEDFDLPDAFVKSPVVLGEQNEEYVEVISGLFPADEVVTRGSYALSFAGSGSGMSLKEALDAAHGHEHNEDGSEMTDEQRAAKKAATEAASGGGKSGAPPWWLIAWASIATLMALFLAQKQFKRRQTPEANTSN